jgi:hypothetical protein
MESMNVTVPEIQTELSLARRRIAELEARPRPLQRSGPI